MKIGRRYKYLVSMSLAGPVFFCFAAAVILMLPASVSAEEKKECAGCHEKTGKAKVSHPALDMGCATCHDETYGREVPHKKVEGKTAGLMTEMPDLCYNCHDKTNFTKKVVHPALDMGCATCHDPHASDFPSLLKKEPVDLCLECHAGVGKTPHAVFGFSAGGHPVGRPKAGKIPDDPARPGKKFWCGSCHNPHSSDYVKLFRYKADTALDLCIYCHKM